MIDLADLPESVAAIEARRLAEGEPVAAVRLAGVQFHSYGRDDGLGGTVSPRRGDRLQLVREPDNPAHAAAVGVWWRNSHRIGHLPWLVAARLAPEIDAGEPVRAYLWREGDGTAGAAHVTGVRAKPAKTRSRPSAKAGGARVGRVRAESKAAPTRKPPPKTVDPVVLLRAACAAAGSQKDWAAAHDLSPAYVNDVLHGRRDPGASVVAALGLEKVVGYRRRVE